MAINKVQFGDSTLIDLTSDTVLAADVVAGKRFHLPNGDQETGTLRCQIIEFTLAAHSSQNVTIGILSDEAYAHIDDTNFSVTLINTTPDSIANNDDYRISVYNNLNLPKANGENTVYGNGNRKVAIAATVQNLPCYYPPNSTDNSASLGGIGKVWHSGKTLYYKSNGYYFSAGTYRAVITW